LSSSKIIAIFGSATLNQNSPAYKETVNIGEIIGELGFDIICGGYYGIMEAVCKGCSKYKREIFGAGMNIFKSPLNKYVTQIKKFNTLSERLQYFSKKADLFLGLKGGIGTITEIFFILDIIKIGLIPPKPIILYGNNWIKLFNLIKSDFIVKQNLLSNITFLSSPQALQEFLKHKLLQSSLT